MVLDYTPTRQNLYHISSTYISWFRNGKGRQTAWWYLKHICFYFQKRQYFLKRQIKKWLKYRYMDPESPITLKSQVKCPSSQSVNSVQWQEISSRVTEWMFAAPRTILAEIQARRAIWSELGAEATRKGDIIVFLDTRMFPRRLTQRLWVTSVTPSVRYLSKQFH